MRLAIAHGIAKSQTGLSRQLILSLSKTRHNKKNQTIYYCYLTIILSSCVWVSERKGEKESLIHPLLGSKFCENKNYMICTFVFAITHSNVFSTSEVMCLVHSRYSPVFVGRWMGEKRDRSSQVYFFHSFRDSLWKLLCMLKYMAEQEWSRGEVSVLKLEPLN